MGAQKAVLFVIVFSVGIGQILSVAGRSSRSRLEDEPSSTSASSVEIRPSKSNSSINAQNELEYSHDSREYDDVEPEVDEVSPSSSTDNYWQFRKMPDDDKNYHKEPPSSPDPTTAEPEPPFAFGEMTQPSIPHGQFHHPHSSAEDRLFITRHSTKIRLPNYTTIWRSNKIIPHGRHRHRRRHRHHHGPPHHHHHGPPSHHYHDHESRVYQKYVPSYISYGPVVGPPPRMRSHSSSTPVYGLPSRGHGHGHHSHGNHGSHSHPSPYTVSSPSGPSHGAGPSPLPPFYGTMAGPSTRYGPPMAAIYVPSPSSSSPPPNRYPASLPYEEYHSTETYYPPSNPFTHSGANTFTRKQPRIKSPFKHMHYGAEPSPVYIPHPPRHSGQGSPTAPRPLYDSPGKSYSSPPMHFGSPMHNFGPPKSSYGQPHPIIGEIPTSRYAPTDDMYKYDNEPPGGGGSGGYSGEMTNFPRNKYGGLGFRTTTSTKGRYNKNRQNDNGWNSNSVEDYYGHGYGGRGESTETHPESYPIDVNGYRQKPTNNVKPPTKPYRPPPQRDKKIQYPYPQADHDEPRGVPYDNFNEYQSSSPQPQAESVAVRLNPGNGMSAKLPRPPPHYDTKYNSPGMSKDPKIVDFMPHSTKDYRQLRGRHRSKSGKKERYSTLPDPLHDHTPDPEHENYPKLTYDTVRKRMLELDLQTSSSDSKRKRED